MALRSVVVVAGCRTPFVKSFTDFSDLSAVDLMTQSVGTLLSSSGLDVKEVSEVLVGCVVPPSGAPNIAREVVLRLGLPPTIPSATVARACASGFTAIQMGAEIG